LTIYLDTSLLIAALTRETASERTRAWLRDHGTGAAISWWVETEIASALSLKLRTGQIEIDHRNAAVAAFRRLVSESLEILGVSQTHFQIAAQFAGLHQAGIRAGDALHLAIAYDYGATLCTLDRRLSEAGPEIGVQTVLV